ncbi:MAG: pyrrolo-quinoline quinone [Acidimicrobiia bacterium]|nr:pyrrolo-quinoline quinone [Acidimicrobiia bacterium]
MPSVTRILRIVRPQLVWCLALLPLLVSAENWTEFRGPTGQGHSREFGLPVVWSETENVAWKVPIPGRGWSSPVLAGEQIWLTTALDNGRSLRALCLDRETGWLVHDVEVFQLPDPGPVHQKNSHASPTPVLDGDRIYLHFGAHGTACLTRSGKVVWKTQDLKYYHRHGPGGSPVVYGDLLILSCDGYDIQFVVALDKHTGKVRWKSPRRGYQAYTTPLTIQVQGKDQLVSPGAHRAVAYEPLTGKEIWSVRYGEGFSNVPRPVYGHGLVFICSGFDQAVLLAVRPDGQGDVTDSHVAWSLKRAVPLTPSPLLVGDELYLVSDIGIATCLDAKTGKAHWQQRLGGNHSASPTLADGRIYFLSEEGESVVIEPGKEFKKLATNHLDGQTLASMAVSGKAIYVRSASHLYRLQQQAQRASTGVLNR